MILKQQKAFEDSFLGAKMPSPTNKRILLASNSPRRRELIGMIVPQYHTLVTRKIDESYPQDMPTEAVAPYLSRVKANAYRDIIDDGDVLITADTIVIVNGEILGKPHSIAEASIMLRTLSGNTHRVMTGVTLMSINKSITFAETTEVTFGTLSSNEINEYIKQYNPLDKAGSYGIQEWIGAVGIKSINGCFYNVMGLPLHTLYQHLKSFV